MWSWIIPIIIEALVKFLTELFKRWQTKPAYEVAVRPSVEMAEEDFVKSMRWKFWLGPRRYDVARQAYQKASSRYGQMVVTLSDSPEDLAEELCYGINDEIKL